MTTNALPNHGTGTFPNSGNPNSITAQNDTYQLPINPVKADNSTYYNVPNFVGVAYNGVKMDFFAAEWYDRGGREWQYAPFGGGFELGFDQNNAHIQPNGSYHYHSVPEPLIHSDEAVMQFLGWARDGYPIYAKYGYSDVSDSNSEVIELKTSYQLKSGERNGGPGGNYDGTYVED